MDIKSIFCPRCGSSNAETVKFCRQCGLPMAPVTGYLVSGVSGGVTVTAPLAGSQGRGNGFTRLLAAFTPRQKMILSIILTAISPAFFAVLDLDELSPIAALLMPFVIIFVIFYFRNQEKQVRAIEAAGQAARAIPPPFVNYVPPPVTPVVEALPSPLQHQVLAPDLTVNPLPGSVTEDETRRLNHQL